MRILSTPHQLARPTRHRNSSDELPRLRDRELNIVFAVDIFNEGVDVPEVDTVLFLRPTESATVFLQQLGRGWTSPRFSPGFVARAARRGGRLGLRPEGRGGVARATSSTPRRAGTAGCRASSAAAGSW